MLPAAGIYYIINVQSGTALEVFDVAGGQVHLVGNPLEKKKPSQQWRLIPAQRGYIIQNMRPTQSGLLYMTVRKLGNSEQVVATPYVAAWDIQSDSSRYEGAVRFNWPATNFMLDLHWGSSKPGTNVEVYAFGRNNSNQHWKLIRHETSPEPSSPTQSTHGTSPQPMVSTSVLVSEDRDFITRVTTVTTIIKTPRFSAGSDVNSTYLPETPTESCFGE